MAAIRMTQEELDAYEKKRRARLAPELSPSPTDSQGKPTPKGKQAKIKAARKESYLEKLLAEQIALAGLPTPEREWKPFTDRRFRCDFAWPQFGLVLEVDGEVHRVHSRFHSDIEKHALLTLAGLRLLRVGSRQVRSGEALDWLKQALSGTVPSGSF